MSPAWEEEQEDDSPWLEEYDDELDEEEEFDDEDEGILEEEDFEEEEPEQVEEEDDLESLIDEGEALVEEGEYAQALDRFREAVERFNECAEAAYKLGDTALMIFANGVETTPNWEDDDELSGYYEEALNGFETALTINRNDCPSLNGLGTLHMVAGNFEAAVEYWERSLDIDPEQEEISSALREARGLLES